MNRNLHQCKIFFSRERKFPETSFMLVGIELRAVIFIYDCSRQCEARESVRICFDSFYSGDILCSLG